MNNQLWTKNTPVQFWKILVDLPQEVCKEAEQSAREMLGVDLQNYSDDELLMMVLGEGQFGEAHYQLSMFKKAYYLIKPILPRAFTRILRKVYHPSGEQLNWPVEDRYIRYLWEFPKSIMTHCNRKELSFIHFWPEGKRFSFILTHDIETDAGQKNIRHVMDLEEKAGFRSSFNIIPERYNIDQELLGEIAERGFEVGIHGLKHDGKLFNSRKIFSRRVKKINHYIEKVNAKGFRTPLMQRQPEWMQELEVEYDLSFFDTDPFEAIPGGTMTIYPFHLGKFIELPYTLVQDYSLQAILEEKTPEIWLKKVDFIEKYYGMALVNVHPDYLLKDINWSIYEEFLSKMKERDNYWHALPKEVAEWWKLRSSASTISELDGAVAARVALDGSQMSIGF